MKPGWVMGENIAKVLPSKRFWLIVGEFLLLRLRSLYQFLRRSGREIGEHSEGSLHTCMCMYDNDT